jgi:uncharacterized membrane protein YuzA (DUF378 family)
MNIKAIIVMICQFFALFGALSWGLIGYTEINPIRAVFGSAHKSVEIIIGISALVLIILKFAQ